MPKNPRSLASLRLVKDYDGGNFNAIETINGVNYKANASGKHKNMDFQYGWQAI